MQKESFRLHQQTRPFHTAGTPSADAETVDVWMHARPGSEMLNRKVDADAVDVGSEMLKRKVTLDWND